jgi:hypothetical protein
MVVKLNVVERLEKGLNLELRFPSGKPKHRPLSTGTLKFISSVDDLIANNFIIRYNMSLYLKKYKCHPSKG